MGKITVLAKGVRRRGSKTAAATQLLSYSEMTLFEGKTGYTLTEARCLEMFEGLRTELELLSLGSYFAEALEAVSEEDSHGPELLSLGLNSLYAVSNGLYPPGVIKPAFEMRLACLAGFAPSLEECSVCGREDIQEPRLSLYGGVLHCAGCPEDGENVPLCGGSLSALRHVCGADAKRIFSFTLGDASLKNLGNASEKYLLAQLGRGFKTLDFYRSIG